MPTRVGALALLLAAALVTGCFAPPEAAVTLPSSTPTGTPVRPPSLQLTTSPGPAPTRTPGATATASATPSVVAARTSTAAPGPPSPAPPPAGRTISLGQPVQLRPTIEVQLAGTPATLILEAVVEDSRCPVDVTCVRAGSVTAVFNLWDGAQALRESVTLRGVEPARVMLGGFEVTLLAVTPEPVAGKEIKPFDYRAQVVVDRPAVRSQTGIDGMVTLGPMCPVVRADQPCPDRPYEATLVVRNAAGSTVARAQSGANGRFSIDLAAGRYVIEPQLPGPGRLPSAASVEVTVPVGGRASVSIAYDTGIR